MTVRFRLLGDVGAQVRGEPIAIGYGQLRSVLAVLLVEANQVVSVDQLVDRIWSGRRLPRKPRAAVQHSMTMLRNALAPAEGVTIVRRSTGYQLTVEPESVDLHRFRRLVDDGRAAEDDARAATLLEEALRLWGGEPFAGLTTAWLESLRATLIQHRHAVRLELVDVQLRHLARPEHAALLLPDLAEWAEQNPLDERLAGQLMLALYRSGRPADALDHYQRMRKRLADELGTDPSPPLHRLHEQILVTDPALTVPRRPPIAVPRQLPAKPRLFSGRALELAELDAALGQDTVVITAVGGLGGMGKTWLASQWAHRNLDRFPDGQLYVNLRGFDPTGQPTPAAAVVRGFLDALGVAPSAVPTGVDAQAGLYRSLVAGRRMLIFLDNAADSAQVAPLLPGSSTCVVLVTSRRHLSGLVTAHGARVLNLDRLTDEEARRLLATHLGEDRLAAEPGVTAELLTCCAGLPLAIGIMAARATAHPDFPLSALVGELREQSELLDALDAGEDLASLRAVFSWSCNALSAEAAAVFGAVGIAPGADIGLPAVASLTALPPARARACLRELEQAHLVSQHAPGRYRMHDLVRLYAAERAHRDTAAVERVVDFYAHTAYAADRTLAPLRHAIAIGAPAEGAVPLGFEDDTAAAEWLTTELPNLLAAQKLAAEQDLHAQVWYVAWSLDTFFRRRGAYQDGLTTWRAAVAAADRTSDRHAQAMTRRHLGNECGGLGLHSEGLPLLHGALAISEETGDLPGQAHAHHKLASLWQGRGDYGRALQHSVPALRLFQDIGLPAQVSWAHAQVGWDHAQLGSYEQARTHCEASLTLARRHRDREVEADALDTLGYVAHHTGDLSQALDHYRRALALFREIGHDYLEANVLERLGRTHHDLGHHDRARTAWLQAIELYRAQRRVKDAADLRQLLDGRSPVSSGKIIGVTGPRP
ncbi:AfsR/SARP family transcriptional regulator [Lentzea sp. NEAU-D7]|uniref:AfsR/SARP family transcriptional regulator n=1 Tax=Lentzea sp. NEAU-D7 TaxID=2994667 RepID=UPI00224A8AFE|nr:BTAD domain-containing putative transcriptional regulator [Lentzea sp. NEAU-D7]MCX2951533.1 BTAD domain-containing putative transcriptional regulator [Lentzea sp. NEAU-D7]